MPSAAPAQASTAPAPAAAQAATATEPQCDLVQILSTVNALLERCQSMRGGQSETVARQMAELRLNVRKLGGLQQICRTVDQVMKIMDCVNDVTGGLLPQQADPPVPAGAQS